MAYFWRSAAGRFEFDWRSAVRSAVRDRTFFAGTLVGLAVLAVAYVVGSALLWPLGVVAVAGGGGLVLVATARRRLSREQLNTHISPALFVYIAALFVLVRGVQDAGITPALVADAVSTRVTPVPRSWPG